MAVGGIAARTKSEKMEAQSEVPVGRNEIACIMNDTNPRKTLPHSSISLGRWNESARKISA
jgi:hypothetical protein